MSSVKLLTSVCHPASLWGLALKKCLVKPEAWQVSCNHEPCQSRFLHFRVTLVMSRSIFTTFSMLAPVPSRKGRPSELLKREGRGRPCSGTATARGGGREAAWQRSGYHYGFSKFKVRLNFSKKKMIYYCLITAL